MMGEEACNICSIHCLYYQTPSCTFTNPLQMNGWGRIMISLLGCTLQFSEPIATSSVYQFFKKDLGV